MVSLQEIKERQVKPIEESVRATNYVLVSGLGALTTHLLHHLLFRLDNTEGQAVVLLYTSPLEVEEVTETDVEHGLYVPTDLGKRKVDVLQERYGGTFETTILAGNRNILTQNTELRGLQGNIFLIEAEKATNPQFNSLFRSMQRLYREENSPYIVSHVHAYVDGDDVHFSSHVREATGRVMGDAIAETEGHTAGSFLQNNLLSNYVFNYINGLLSLGMSVDVQQVKGDIIQGDTGLEKTYFTPPLVTIFDNYGIDTSSIGQDVLQAFHNEWKAIEESVLPASFEAYISHFNQGDENATQRARDGLVYLHGCANAYIRPINSLQFNDTVGLRDAFSLLHRKISEETDAKISRARTGRQRLEDSVKEWLMLKEYCKQKGTWIL